jgi:glycosyltransferase involved in cell wall biosynthesis
MRTLVQRLQFGQVVDPESPEAVARALETILGDSDVRTRMRSRTYAASKVYNWENEVEKLVRAYRRFVC